MAENKTTLKKVAKIVADFMNHVGDGTDNAYNNAVNVFKSEFELSSQQEAMIRNLLMHLELMAIHIDDPFMNDFVGLDCNVIISTIENDWDALNRRILSGDFDPSAS